MGRGLYLLGFVVAALAVSWLLLSVGSPSPSPRHDVAAASRRGSPAASSAAHVERAAQPLTTVPSLLPRGDGLDRAQTVDATLLSPDSPPNTSEAPPTTAPPSPPHKTTLERLPPNATLPLSSPSHGRWSPRSPAPSTSVPSVACQRSVECVWDSARRGFVPGARGIIAGSPGTAANQSQQQAATSKSRQPQRQGAGASRLPFFIAAAMDRARLATLSLELLRTVDYPVDTLVLHVNNPVLGRGLNGSEPAAADGPGLGGWLRKDFDAVLAAAKMVARTVHVIIGWGAYADSCAGQWNAALDVFMDTSTADWFVLSAVDVTFSKGGLEGLVQHVNATVPRQSPQSGFLWHPHYNRRGSKAHIPTWNVIIANRATLAAAGRFDETFFPAYHEDFDYRARLSAADIHESRVPWKVMRAFHPAESATRTDVRSLRQCAIDCVARTINVGHKNSKQCKAAVERSKATVIDVSRRQLDALDVHPVDEDLRALVRGILSRQEPVFSKLCHPCVEATGPRVWKTSDAPPWAHTPPSPLCPTLKQSLESDGYLPVRQSH